MSPLSLLSLNSTLPPPAPAPTHAPLPTHTLTHTHTWHVFLLRFIFSPFNRIDDDSVLPRAWISIGQTSPEDCYHAILFSISKHCPSSVQLWRHPQYWVPLICIWSIDKEEYGLNVASLANIKLAGEFLSICSNIKLSLSFPDSCNRPYLNSSIEIRSLLKL